MARRRTQVEEALLSLLGLLWREGSLRLRTTKATDRKLRKIARRGGKVDVGFKA